MKQQNKIHRIYINSQFSKDIYHCSDELAHRIINVLRVSNSEDIIIFNSNNEQYLCSVVKDHKKVSLFIKKKITNKPQNNKKVNLALSIVSMKVMDLVIQKSVELGVNNFYPVYTQRSQYHDVSKKIDHWKKVIIHSSEQCGRYDLMSLIQPSSLDQYIAENSEGPRYLLFQNGEKFNPQDLNKDNITLFIGPEGGFDDNEINIFKINQWKIKKISENILRTETACISALALIENYESFSRHSL
tara:strand:+ start:7357 stop:8088 length:732 start_codon:yes stop_codon:yes gene_type:complete